MRAIAPPARVGLALRLALRGWGCRRHAAPALIRLSCSNASKEGTAVEGTKLRLVATSPLATQVVAHYFAASLLPGDCYLLYGDVGAGKSYFSRAFIRAAAQDEDLPVPSPTFLLQNIYSDHSGPAVHHYDLYRLTQQRDLARLDLPTTLPQSQALQPQLAPPLGGSLGQEDEDGELSDEEGSGDVRWRHIELVAHGQHWEQQLAPLEGHVRQRGSMLGLYLHPPAPAQLPAAS